MQIVFWLLGGLGKLLRAALGLIRDYPWQAITLGLCLALLLVFRQWGIDHRDLTDQIGEANGTIAEERIAHAATIENVRRGQEMARELDRRNVERAAAAKLAANERALHDLQNRYRASTAGADRLRARLAALEAPAGGGGTEAVPGVSEATCRAFGAADCDQLAARMIDGQASIDKLIALQAWAREVSAIEVGGGPD
jgi:hypothetical protein